VTSWKKTTSGSSASLRILLRSCCALETERGEKASKFREIREKGELTGSDRARCFVIGGK
jgi:hypothetical protein